MKLSSSTGDFELRGRGRNQLLEIKSGSQFIRGQKWFAIHWRSKWFAILYFVIRKATKGKKKKVMSSHRTTQNGNSLGD